MVARLEPQPLLRPPRTNARRTRPSVLRLAGVCAGKSTRVSCGSAFFGTEPTPTPRVDADCRARSACASASAARVACSTCKRPAAPPEARLRGPPSEPSKTPHPFRHCPTHWAPATPSNCPSYFDCSRPDGPAPRLGVAENSLRGAEARLPTERPPQQPLDSTPAAPDRRRRAFRGKPMSPPAAPKRRRRTRAHATRLEGGGVQRRGPPVRSGGSWQQSSSSSTRRAPPDGLEFSG